MTTSPDLAYLNSFLDEALEQCAWDLDTVTADEVARDVAEGDGNFGEDPQALLPACTAWLTAKRLAAA